MRVSFTAHATETHKLVSILIWCTRMILAIAFRDVFIAFEVDRLLIVVLLVLEYFTVRLVVGPEDLLAVNVVEVLAIRKSLL